MRKRKKLEVSTFPFLAVLLCTMGSLILLLLVMDKKAKKQLWKKPMKMHGINQKYCKLKQMLTKNTEADKSMDKIKIRAA